MKRQLKGLKDLKSYLILVKKQNRIILESIAFLKRSQGRFLLSEALFLAEDIMTQLKEVKEIDQLVFAGFFTSLERNNR